MKKYLFILISSSFLFSSEGAKAAENRDVVKIAATMTAKPHWADFMADPTYDAVKGNMSLRGPHAIREALEAAYDAWRPGYLAANPAVAGAAFRAAVAPAGKKGAKATAASVAGDAETLIALGKRHKAALITAMAADDVSATAAAVVGNALTLRSLGINHKAALIRAMAANDDSVGTHATADEAVGSATVLAHLGEHHKAALIGAMSAHSAVDTATAIVADDALLAAVVKRWIKGDDPTANANKGNGVWNNILTGFNPASHGAIQSVFADAARVGGQRLFPQTAIGEGSIPV